MILTCPNCSTRYQVADGAVERAGGRDVRCANCGHGWHHQPTPLPIRASEPPIAPPFQPRRPRLATTPRPAIIAPTPPPRRRSGAGWVVLLLLLMVIAGAAAGAFYARDRIIAIWPPATRIYDQLGLKTGTPDSVPAGLEIDKVVSNRTADGLSVEGDVTNPGGAARIVPKLRVAVRDASKNELAVKIVDPPKPRLAPGETAHFTVDFIPASDQATGVAVTFAGG